MINENAKQQGVAALDAMTKKAQAQSNNNSNPKMSIGSKQFTLRKFILTHFESIIQKHDYFFWTLTYEIFINSQFSLNDWFNFFFQLTIMILIIRFLFVYLFVWRNYVSIFSYIDNSVE